MNRSVGRECKRLAYIVEIFTGRRLDNFHVNDIYLHYYKSYKIHVLNFESCISIDSFLLHPSDIFQRKHSASLKLC